MVRNHVQYIILVQVSILASGSQGQYATNNGGQPTSPLTKYPCYYLTSNYYPSNAHPYPSPYCYGQFAYPAQSASAQCPQSSSSTRPQNGSPPPTDVLRTQQQYFFGPMNAAQAKYLTAYVNNLMYGSNTTTAPQTPSTPPENASSMQPTPTKSPSTSTPSSPLEPTPTATTISPEPVTPIANNESSQLPTTTEVIPLDVTNSTLDVQQPTPTPAPSILQLENNTSDTSDSANQSSTTLTAPVSESSDRIQRSVQDQSNPFVSNPAYRTQNWLYEYNPTVSSFYGNLQQSSQPYYPPGFGPWNPFVLSPQTLRTPQPNETELFTSTSPPSGQGNSSETPSVESTAGQGGLTNVEDLPPQVKEFIDMIPDILSMPETSQLSPSNNNAIIHRLVGAGENGAQMGIYQFGRGSMGVPSAPQSYYNSKGMQQCKKRCRKPLRRHVPMLNIYK